jgi:hypothetical protein
MDGFEDGYIFLHCSLEALFRFSSKKKERNAKRMQHHSIRTSSPTVLLTGPYAG